ncbi:phage portal protein [Ketogulonicigenium vulgare]|uniref:phage portal protein n=1 Tax=Ketogulonicigenium vulgare TaxID=92945 RepID=UPI00235A1210|nr:phage portal protein [Ketogulonicigenium vulgare]
MNLIDKVISAVSPEWGMKRARARAATMVYRAANLNRRSDSLRPSNSDANVAGRARLRVAHNMRDLVRNVPFAARARSVIANNVVGDGIIPKVTLNVPQDMTADLSKAFKDRGMHHIEQTLDTVRIDKKGLQNLYGLQRQVINTVIESGEALVRRHICPVEAGAGLPLKIEVLEPDYLDSSRQWAGEGDNIVIDGIEYDDAGTRVAYWLFTQHPGGEFIPSRSQINSVRVPAEDVIHVFLPDRSGQDRGVSWFAPVAEKLLTLDDYEDALLVRQQIASCFVMFRKLGSGGQGTAEIGDQVRAGSIIDLGEDEDVDFATPPVASGDDQFISTVLREIAVGMGISYEALTGDLRGVNFSSARIGRLEMDRSVSSWQWLMMVPQMLQPLSDWIGEAWAEYEAQTREWDDPALGNFIDGGVISLTWVPPVRLMIDPSGEFSAFNVAVRSGFMSRQGVVRTTGVDPERLMQEQHQDKMDADALGLIFDSDPRADISRQILKGQSERKQDE